MAEKFGPMRLVAELLAPGPETPRRLMQRVFVGEAHRAMHLMRDRGAVAGGLADPDFGDRDLGLCRLIADTMVGDRLRRALGSRARRRDLACQLREIVLHGLELGDWPTELDAVQRPLHGLVENVFE